MVQGDAGRQRGREAGSQGISLFPLTRDHERPEVYLNVLQPQLRVWWGVVVFAGVSLLFLITLNRAYLKGISKCEADSRWVDGEVEVIRTQSSHQCVYRPTFESVPLMTKPKESLSTTCERNPKDLPIEPSVEAIQTKGYMNDERWGGASQYEFPGSWTICSHTQANKFDPQTFWRFR